MTRKEGLCAVIGGVAGAVLVIAVGSIAPLGAENEKVDLNAGEITCTRLSVVDEDGTRVLIDKAVSVYGKQGAGVARMGIDGRGGNIVVYGNDVFSRAVMRTNEAGGVVEAVRADLDKNKGAWTSISIGEHGGFVYVKGKDNESWAGMVMGEHGGVVSVSGKDGKSKAGMGIDEGGGVVNLYGKDGTLNRITPE